MENPLSMIARLLAGPQAPKPWGVPGDALATTATNPVGWSSTAAPQYMSNQDPSFSEMARKDNMTPQQAVGAMLLGKGQPITNAQLPAAEDKAQTFMDYGMAVAGAVNPVGIRAFHGSPHTFDRFDMSKLGTGEGAQAYGHGLYFAGEEGVARSYRDALAPGAQMTLNGSPLSAATDPVKRVAMWIRNTGAHPEEIARISEQRAAKAATEAEQLGLDGRAFAEEHSAMADAARKLAQVGKWELGTAPNGSMYEVNLRTSPERLLDWDKPLVQQPHVTERLPASLRDELLKIGEKTKSDWGDLGVGTSADQYATGQSLYRTLQKKADDAWFANPKPPPWRTTGINTAKALQKQGIDGIQYLDGGSRAAGEGSRNYVMFDDKLIDILRRYGLLGLVGGGAAAAGSNPAEAKQ